MIWNHGFEFATDNGALISVGDVTRRPVGDFIPGDAGCMFAGAPRNAVVISQPSQDGFVLPFIHVLSSETRKSPDLVQLLPTEVIRVQVNFDQYLENYRRGQFDLWVKVID
jgi:hypothetical protein